MCLLQLYAVCEVYVNVPVTVVSQSCPSRVLVVALLSVLSVLYSHLVDVRSRYAMLPTYRSLSEVSSSHSPNILQNASADTFTDARNSIVCAGKFFKQSMYFNVVCD